jgi:hypothetical protein
MKTTKFYYSKPVHVRLIPVMTDAQGEPLYIFRDESITKIVRTVPRVTVASVYDPEKNVMSFGVAVCSPKDIFKKSIGRELALERAKTKPVAVVSPRRGRIRSVSKRYANEIMSSALSKDVQFEL